MDSDSGEHEEILIALTAGLRTQFGQHLHIEQWQRQRYDYWSSCALDELTIQLSDGHQVLVLLKDLCPASMVESTRRARDQQLYNPAREISVYNRLLATLPLRTAGCYGSRINPHANHYWLFLEKVIGEELYKVAEFERWKDAARWLADFHCMTSNLSERKGLELFEWDRAALEHCSLRVKQRYDQHVRPPLNAQELDDIRAAYRVAMQTMLDKPQSVIHGEFYASNVLIERSTADTHVCPVDWETTGWGCSLIDLAALTAGRWSDSQRNKMVLAYWLALDDQHRTAWRSLECLQYTLTACRLHLAMLMLGRPVDWQPPAEHKQDWLQHAIELSQRIAH